MKPGPNFTNPLETQLRAAKPCDPFPPDLHPAIMAAVRRSAQMPAPHPPRVVGRGLLGLGLGTALVLSALWIGQRHSPPAPGAASHPLTFGAVTLDQGRQWTERIPEVMLAPLTQEMDALHRDVRNAWDFLLASMP